MSVATVSSKGQIVIPKDARKKLGLKRGSKVKITVEADRMIITPIAEPPTELFTDAGPHAVPKALNASRELDEKKIRALLAALGVVD
ncbi:MAG: AbrB/MazE/SpoVT family DNA-binding domain-containing protein [Candidatus Bathyarchaeia archaeon]